MNLITFSHNLPASYNIIEYDFDLNQRIRTKLIDKYKQKKQTQYKAHRKNKQR